ncbi:MAG TPA: 3-keto-5-aminohexanoate cleavage protein, partial [Mycobacteriales bacterium]|nr:3-keto-5-aminohexanoate cleavage protein [Mycobacteriales bacterium]
MLQLALLAGQVDAQESGRYRRASADCNEFQFGGEVGDAMAEPVIIEAAINGVTSKNHNPNTPKEPAEIADDALRCFAAGAAVVHNHIDSFGLDGTRA